MHRGGVQATEEPWLFHVVDTCLQRLDGQAKDPSNLRGRAEGRWLPSPCGAVGRASAYMAAALR